MNVEEGITCTGGNRSQASVPLMVTAISEKISQPLCAGCGNQKKSFGRVVEFLEGTVVGSLQHQVGQIKLLMSRATVRDGPDRSPGKDTVLPGKDTVLVEYSGEEQRQGAVDRCHPGFACFVSDGVVVGWPGERPDGGCAGTHQKIERR